MHTGSINVILFIYWLYVPHTPLRTYAFIFLAFVFLNQPQGVCVYAPTHVCRCCANKFASKKYKIINNNDIKDMIITIVKYRLPNKIKYTNISIIKILLITIIDFSKTLFGSPNRKLNNIEFNIIMNPAFLLGIAFNKA